MKRRDLLEQFQKNGWFIEREGGGHTVVRKGEKQEYIPRHREIDERLAKSMIKRWGLK